MKPINLDLTDDDIQINELRNNLINSKHRSDIENSFVNHIKSKYLEKAISRQLMNIAQIEDFAVPKGWGKFALRIFEDEQFTYTTTLLVPGEVNRNHTCWKGNSEILAIKGPGSMKVRLLKVPAVIDINSQTSKLSLLEEKVLDNGTIFSNWDDHTIIEIIEIYSPVVVERLEIKNKYSAFFWFFDSNLHPAGKVSSKLFLGRMQAIINLAMEMETDIPQQLYDAVFAVGDAKLTFMAIEAMLLEGHVDSELHLQKALSSEDTTLSDLAQTLYNKLIAAQ